MLILWLGAADAMVARHSKSEWSERISSVVAVTHTYILYLDSEVPSPRIHMPLGCQNVRLRDPGELLQFLIDNVECTLCTRVTAYVQRETTSAQSLRPPPPRSPTRTRSRRWGDRAAGAAENYGHGDIMSPGVNMYIDSTNRRVPRREQISGRLDAGIRGGGPAGPRRVCNIRAGSTDTNGDPWAVQANRRGRDHRVRDAECEM
ncbi:hypothetical protein L226DRAFT_285374 [Lentinus tigrinus ALCF2SS1-7]|uniref:uncharacterized protein n=1 Tax=Lentinus tigrinus ALCF2SS1-7 TaxID=1328758 RepID=UPI001165D45D|nr:hypothetical protein L226DRAFT_285374 [Lentinus tigrinus ALCF2SS1-7]